MGLIRTLAAIGAFFSAERRTRKAHLSQRLEEFCNHTPRDADLRAVSMELNSREIRRVSKGRAKSLRPRKVA
jgi:hypothetical protein